MTSIAAVVIRPAIGTATTIMIAAMATVSAAGRGSMRTIKAARAKAANPALAMVSRATTAIAARAAGRAARAAWASPWVRDRWPIAARATAVPARPTAGAATALRVPDRKTIALGAAATGPGTIRNTAASDTVRKPA